MSSIKSDPQYIALCTKVTQELESQYGLKDEDLTEFIISLAKESKTDKEFMKNLQENDAEFTFSFTKNLFTLIKKMLPQAPAQKDSSVLKDHVSAKEEKKTNERTTTSNQGNRTLSQKFPGLSMPNNPNPEELDLGSGLAPATAKEEDKPARRKPDISKSRSRSRSRSGDRHKKKHSKKRRSSSSRSRSRSRSSSSRRDRKRKDRKEEFEGDPNIGRVYEGTVTSVMDYGCFVSLNNFRKKTEGLVHVSNIKSERIGHPKEHVSKGDRVKVKVAGIDKGKIKLSMKDVDQDTGEHLGERDRTRKSGNDRGERSKGDRGYGSITGIKLDEQKGPQKNKKTMEIDPFELAILKSKGKVGTLPKDLQELEEINAEEDVQEIEVEAKEEEPGFLKGQTTRAGIELSPVRVVKNPKGSLQHEIMSSMQIARERGENKTKQDQAQDKDALPKFTKVFKSDSKPDPFAENSEERRQNYEKSFLPETRRKKMAILDQRKSLPIYKYKEELLKTIKENKILIIIGETGSGKTTQILQYLYEEGYTRGGKRIGCTQPRKVSATSIAKRVSEEMGVKLGEEVGYAIRFEDYTSPKTVLKYMTEGVLLREALADKNVSNYRVIVLDEAHERTINMDVLFGLMKQTAERRDDFRLIVTSATLDAEKFSQYFYNCNIFRIPGRTFPVDVMYTKEPESDYLEAALTTVMQIHLTEPPGDILLFLTGQEEIDTSCQMLNERMKKLGDDAPELICLPIYSALPSELQDRIFEPAPIGARKCVIATNIAEASLTIDGIYYVIDPGFAKIKTYDAKQRMDTLKVSPISQASANQRAGRAGRTGPGKCFRLYTEQAFKSEMLPASVPEIQRTNMANTVLILKAMGINDLINFDFMDPPPIQTLVAALETLYALSALDDDGYLTKLGRKMSEFPLDPELSKMLLTAVDLGCTDEVITIIAMLSVQNIFYRPKERQQQADEKRAQFFHPDGDHITMLTVFQNWESNQYSPGWCHENFIQLRTMRKAQDTKKQLKTILERSKLPVVKCNNDFQRIRKAITAGYFAHAARKDPQEGYKTLIEGQQVYIHPSSSLFSKSPDWVMYHELVLTSKEFMREVCTIEPKWLIEVAPNFFKMADPNTISKRKKAEKLEPLQSKHEDPNAWRLSRRKG